MKRGQTEYPVNLPNGVVLIIIATVIDSIGRLYAGRNSGQILRTRFALRPGGCVAPAIDLLTVGPGTSPPGLQQDQSEHPVEVREMLSRAEARADPYPID